MNETRGTQFQFTPLREGRRRQFLRAARNLQFQFTPLREGRLLAQERRRIAKYISIHAPA